MLDALGRIRDLSKVIPDIAGDELSPKGLAKLRKVNVDKLPLVRGTPRMAVRRQSRSATITLNPLTNRPRADASGFADGPASVRSPPVVRSALDQAASAGHSYACSSGPHENR
jgi:hypothetical protein